MPVSPGEYNHEGVVALHGEDFAGPFRDSEQNVAEGRPDVLIRPGVPWGSTWSARAYVDCFNQDNRYSVTRHAENTGCPTLFIYGAEECAVGGPQELPVCGAARRSLEAAEYPHVQLRVIQGAAHGYMARGARALQHNARLAERALRARDHQRSSTRRLEARPTGEAPIARGPMLGGRAMAKTVNALQARDQVVSFGPLELG